VYANDEQPGIRRRQRRGKFEYIGPSGRRIRSARVLKRIKGLVIPPAWNEVWICPHSRGHIQATGRDARGRKQYIYHPKWRILRDSAKYDRLSAFAQALGPLRKRLDRDLRRRGLSKDKVVATVVALMESTLMRVGNEEYVKQNGSFGITTLRNRHVAIEGPCLHFQFRGKSGVLHTIDIHDRRLAKIVKACQELPGQELFEYIGADGAIHSVRSEDVNAYLRAATGHDFTAKDIRTWAGTVLAAEALRQCDCAGSEAQAKRNIVAAIEQVARKLGNTKTVCRQCYIHPAVFQAYHDGRLSETPAGKRARSIARALAHLSADEASLYLLLQ